MFIKLNINNIYKILSGLENVVTRLKAERPEFNFRQR